MVLEELLERARKVADEAEVFYLVHHDEPVIFEGNRLKLVERRDTAGVALRLIKDGRVGLSSSSNMSDLESVVAHALEVSQFGPQANLQFPTTTQFSPVEVYDPEVERVTAEDMIQLGQTLIDRLREGYPDLVGDATVGKGTMTVTVLNSRGGHASYTKSSFSVFGHGTIVKDTDMLFVYDGASSCHPILNIDEVVDSIRLQLEHSRVIVPAPVNGERPCVVFTPRGVAGALLSPLLAGFNGKTVLQGASPLGGRQGDKLLDQRFSLWDEPSIPFAPGSRTCDDEGVPSRRLSLVDRGIIDDFLYDLETAARAGTQSTGGAHRSLGSSPEPGVSVIKISEGDVPLDKMVKDIGNGLVVERLLGAGQSNIQGGDFNANVLLGFRIEQGEITGRVKNTVISGNVYKTLGELVALEETSHWVGGSLKAPALASYNVSVATQG